MSVKEKDTTRWVQKNVNKQMRPTGSNPKDRLRPKFRRKSKSGAVAQLSEADVPTPKNESRKSGKFALAVLVGGVIAVLARGIKKSVHHK